MNHHSTVYLPPELKKRLTAEALRLTKLQHAQGIFEKVSESELIRRALDAYLPKMKGEQ